MSNPSIREQFDIAINGSSQFHSKSASTDGTITPDTVLPGHGEIAGQLQGLSLLIDKTADYVAKGFPAKVALAHLGEQFGIVPAYLEKLAALIDETGDYALRDMVDDTYQEKLAEFRAKTKTAQTESSRTDQAIRRMAQLSGMIGKN